MAASISLAAPLCAALAGQGQWSIVLTPTKYVPRTWFLSLNGLDVLCLASGGGQHDPTQGFCLPRDSAAAESGYPSADFNTGAQRVDSLASSRSRRAAPVEPLPSSRFRRAAPVEPLPWSRLDRKLYLPCTCRDAPRRTKRNTGVIVAHQPNEPTAPPP